MRILVIAKSPVVGRVKTRLGAVTGARMATELAAAALLDTLEAAASTVGAEQCQLALMGDLADAVRSDEIIGMLQGWEITQQRGADFAERLAAAHLDAGPGPVAQIGMDTPQVTTGDLARVFDDLSEADAVLGAAGDGGWWVLGRRDPLAAQVLSQVAMSQATTHADTWAALEDRGVRVAATHQLRDVDTVEDAEVVAAAAPQTRFAAAWRAASRTAS